LFFDFPELKKADGVVDAADARFGELRVWRDLNQNGVSDAGELQTLADAGITSIALTRTDVAGTNTGHVRGFAAQFTRANGTTGSAETIYFQTDRQQTADLHGGGWGRAAVAAAEFTTTGGHHLCVVLRQRSERTTSFAGKTSHSAWTGFQHQVYGRRLALTWSTAAAGLGDADAICRAANNSANYDDKRKSTKVLHPIG
jgi:hypothetical protein